MAQRKKFRIDLTILVPVILLAVISIFTINSAESLLLESTNYATRQTIWYIIGFACILAMVFLKNHNIVKFTWVAYWTLVVLLIILLIFGEPINNAKSWFTIQHVGAFQPSEFMKIVLILTLASMLENFRDKHSEPTVGQEFLFLLKVLGIVLIPSILTFLQPDTGVVVIYLLITFVMLFIAGIRYRWFILCLSLIAILLSVIVGMYFMNTELFIKVFGTDFFLRIDRLLDWSQGSGYQLENGMTAIGSGGLLGKGYNMTPLYFPEPQTDFIFAVYASNFGFAGSVGLILLLLYIDIRLIILAINANKNINKYIISGIVAMLIYQQFQNIGMTFGLIPITGITLPFISYGGSSLLSYMVMLGILFNISNEEVKTGLI